MNDQAAATAVPLERLDPKLSLSLRDHVHKALRIAIMSGRYAPQQRLNERQLAQELGVSTTPLKEALRQLEAEGLVATLPRRGVIVLYGKSWAEEMILARAALESMIARMAARNISPSDADSLGVTLAEMTAASATDDPDGLIALNETFHEQIHTISRCRYLSHLIERQRLYDAGTRRIIHTDRDEKARALSEHTVIAAAIVARNADTAEQAMRDHVMRSGEHYLQLVFGHPNKSS